MKLDNSILEDVREALGLGKDVDDFDTEILMHINSALSVLHQNGVNKFLIVDSVTQTWKDLIDPLKLEGNVYFGMVPLYVKLSTKLIFDPPPPSTVEQYSKNIEETLWRLKTAYDEPLVKDVPIQ